MNKHYKHLTKEQRYYIAIKMSNNITPGNLVARLFTNISGMTAIAAESYINCCHVEAKNIDIVMENAARFRIGLILVNPLKLLRKRNASATLKQIL